MEHPDNFDAQYALKLYYSNTLGHNSFTTYMGNNGFSRQQIWGLRRILEHEEKSKTRRKKCFLFCAKKQYDEKTIDALKYVWFYGNPAEREQLVVLAILEN